MKYLDEEEDFSSDEHKNINLNNLRQETELFNDDSYVPHQLISIRYISLPKKGGDWEIMVDKKPQLLIKGIRFSKPEQNWLKTYQGMQFLINGYKLGWKSVSEFKRQIAKCMK